MNSKHMHLSYIYGGGRMSANSGSRYAGFHTKVFAQHLQMVQSILSFDTSLLKDGLYIARLQLINGQFVVQKIVIKH
jgi:hypothetical protein